MKNFAVFKVILVSCFALFMSGCGVQQSAPAVPRTSTPLGKITGNVHGGQQPLAYPHIYMYAVGTGGYGTASDSLLLPGVDTTKDSSGQYYTTGDQNGNFLLTGQYLCTPGTQVYVYVSGGIPGLGSGQNSAIGLMAALGQCPATQTLASQVPFVTINEVSTVVTAYALAGFAIDGRNIASSNTALAETGVANAMMTALNMIDVANGLAPGSSATGNALLPAQNINTLANILASCVNSAGPGSANCQTLLSDTANAADTAAAAIAIAHAPFANVATLFDLPSPSPPFQPSLASVPTDFTLAVFHVGSTARDAGIALEPNSVAIDAAGDLWIYNESETSSEISNLAKFSPAGEPLASIDFTQPSGGGHGMDIDQTGQVWINQFGGVAVFSNAGTELSPADGYTCMGFGGGNTAIQFGTDGTAYVGDSYAFGASGVSLVTWKFSPNGSCLGYDQAATGGKPLTGQLTGISVDSLNNLFFLDNPFSNNELLIKTAPNGLQTEYTTVIPSDSLDLGYPVFDGVNQLWYTGTAGPIVYSGTGILISPAAGYPGSTNYSSSASTVNFDGADNAWVLDMYYGNTISAYTHSGALITPSQDLAVPSFQGNSPVGIQSAIDGAGNLWLLQLDGSLVEFVGIAVPVATPVTASQYGIRP